MNQKPNDSAKLGGDGAWIQSQTHRKDLLHKKVRMTNCPVTKEPVWAVITRAPARERAMTAQQSRCSVTKSCLTLWTPGTAVQQASLSFTISQSLLKLMSMEGRCHPTISSSVIPFSSCPQSFPASGSFPMSELFTSGGQSIGAPALASVLPKSIQD